MANVRVIPALAPIISAQERNSAVRRRVTAYARVSTDSAELEVVTELSRKAIYENARTALSQREWSERNNGYLERHRQASQRAEELEAQKRERLGKGKILEGFIRDIQSRELAITEFDGELWLAVVDKAMVKRDGSMSFRFKNSSEITA